jgi:hypothetical protein
VTVATGVDVWVGVAVRVVTAVAVGVGVLVIAGVEVGVLVIAGVDVLFGVGVLVRAGVDVFFAVGVLVMTGVDVGFGLGVLVASGSGVDVLVGFAVGVGVAVRRRETTVVSGLGGGTFFVVSGGGTFFVVSGCAALNGTRTNVTETARIVARSMHRMCPTVASDVPRPADFRSQSGYEESQQSNDLRAIFTTKRPSTQRFRGSPPRAQLNVWARGRRRVEGRN